MEGERTHTNTAITAAFMIKEIPGMIGLWFIAVGPHLTEAPELEILTFEANLGFSVTSKKAKISTTHIEYYT